MVHEIGSDKPAAGVRRADHVLLRRGGASATAEHVAGYGHGGAGGAAAASIPDAHARRGWLQHPNEEDYRVNCKR